MTPSFSHPGMVGGLKRRSVLFAGAAVTAAGLTVSGAVPARAASRARGPRPAVVLVHGAWADGSSWAAVVAGLQRAGVRVVAVQLDLDSVAADADTVRRAVAEVDGPVVLAAHSYGGAVITLAGQDNPAVKGLVFAAAFAPDTGESLGALVGRFPASAALEAIVADTSGRLILDRERFPALFAPDVPASQARVLAAVQGSVNGATFSETLTGTPAWRQVPSWYQVSSLDSVVAPDLQAFLAARMGAATTTLRTGHASPVSRPKTLVRLILRAVQTVA